MVAWQLGCCWVIRRSDSTGCWRVVRCSVRVCVCGVCVCVWCPSASFRWPIVAESVLATAGRTHALFRRGAHARLSVRYGDWLLLCHCALSSLRSPSRHLNGTADVGWCRVVSCTQRSSVESMLAVFRCASSLTACQFVLGLCLQPNITKRQQHESNHTCTSEQQVTAGWATQRCTIRSSVLRRTTAATHACATAHCAKLSAIDFRTGLLLCVLRGSGRCSAGWA